MLNASRLGLFVLCLAIVGQQTAWSQHPSQWLPDNILIYAEAHRPAELVETVYDHPVTAKVLEIEDVAEGLKSKEFREAMAAVKMAEAQIGKDWPEIVADVVGQGMVLGVSPEPDSVALFAHANEIETTQKLLETILFFARADENNDEVKEAEYRSQKVYGIGDAKVTMLGDWLLVTNNGDFGKSIVDRYLDKTSDALDSHETFKLAHEARNKESAVWAHVNLAMVRDSGEAADLFGATTDNPATELLVGGFLDVTRNIDGFDLEFDLTKDALTASMTSPFSESWITEEREYFWGFGGTGTAAPKLEVPDVLLSVSAYRDVAEMWLRSGDLLQDEAADGIVQAESVLSTLFLGKDFGEDILAAFEPNVDIVVTPQTFENEGERPSIVLPSFGIVFDFKDPEAMQPQFKRIFQSLIGFLNVTSAMQGQPQLELDMNREDGTQIVTGRYLTEDDESYEDGLPLQFNFSPTIAFREKRFVLSSTEELAWTLAKATRAEDAADADTVVNTTAFANLEPLSSVLHDNREQLVAQNMLEEGNSRDEAEKSIQALLNIVDMIETASLSLKHDESEVSISLEIKTAK